MRRILQLCLEFFRTALRLGDHSMAGSRLVTAYSVCRGLPVIRCDRENNGLRARLLEAAAAAYFQF
jgi:hypothetical protein